MGPTGHGFGGIASTALSGMGLRDQVIETQLSHIDNNRTCAAYNRKTTYSAQRLSANAGCGTPCFFRCNPLMMRRSPKNNPPDNNRTTNLYKSDAIPYP